jgi:hypothetical protein
MHSVLFTTCMRFGDTLHVLPIASWYAKQHGVKVSWAVDQQEYTQPTLDILAAQPFIDTVHVFNYSKHRHPKWPKPRGDVLEYNSQEGHSCHRPYHRIGARLPIAKDYDFIYDFGYVRHVYEHRQMPFFTHHFATEHGFGVDHDYKLEFGEPDYKYAGQVVKLDKFYAPVMQDVEGINLDEKDGVIQNLRYCAGAGAVATTRTGAAVMLSLARIPFGIRFLDDDYDWYKKIVHTITGGIHRI